MPGRPVECLHVCMCLCALGYYQDGASGCNGILLPPDCQLVNCLHAVPFDLALATTPAECTSDALSSFVVQSCGSHFIYWAFNFSQYGSRGGGGVGWSGVGVSLCLISLPQSIPLNKISYDVQRKDVSTED